MAHIAGLDDRTLAEVYSGLEIAVPGACLPELDEGIITGASCRACRYGRGLADGTTVLLGSVDYLIETGANDVLVVKACEGSIDTAERLIPYLPGNR